MKGTYPLIALGLGILMTLVMWRFGPLAGGVGPKMPLLTALLVCELGFLITVVAVVLAVRAAVTPPMRWVSVLTLIGNLLLATNFVRVGLALWPETGGVSQ